MVNIWFFGAMQWQRCLHTIRYKPPLPFRRTTRQLHSRFLGAARLKTTEHRKTFGLESIKGTKKTPLSIMAL